MSVEERIRISIERFNLCVPTLTKWLGGGRFLPVEGDSNLVCEALDCYSGIDFLQVFDDHKKTRGGAFRGQQLREYDGALSLSLRESEYRRFKAAIADGWIYPKIFVHAYFKINEEVLAMIHVVRLRDLMSFFETGYGTHWYRDINTQDDNQFLVAPLRSLEDRNVSFKSASLSGLRIMRLEDWPRIYPPTLSMTPLTSP